MKVVSVLKAGPDFTEVQARLLHNQLYGFDNVCMTDLKNCKGINTTPLGYNYPTWWAKINLFNPDHPVLGKEDIFYIDIDTLIVGDISIFFNQPTFTALTDFYYLNSKNRPMASGVMWIPAEQKEIVWRRWYGREKRVMNEKHPMPYHGDQGFISRCFAKEAITVPRWDQLYPNRIVSYKKDIAKRGMNGFHKNRSRGDGKVPDGTRIVCFHGKPRPWDINCGLIVD